jgi:two-component system cell cycle response regulator
MKLIAGVCRQNLRHFDIIGRYSGESFIVLLPETDLNVAADVADRLRKCVEEMRVETHRGELRVTISIGVAVSRNGETVPDLAGLINKADMALYEAKRAGRNRVITG